MLIEYFRARDCAKSRESETCAYNVTENYTELTSGYPLTSVLFTMEMQSRKEWLNSVPTLLKSCTLSTLLLHRDKIE